MSEAHIEALPGEFRDTNAWQSKKPGSFIGISTIYSPILKSNWQAQSPWQESVSAIYRAELHPEEEVRLPLPISVPRTAALDAKRISIVWEPHKAPRQHCAEALRTNFKQLVIFPC
jgi:hypothetical protein